MKKHVVKNDGFVQVAKSSKALTMFNEYFLVVVIVVVFLTRKSKINKQLKNSLNENLLNKKKICTDNCFSICQRMFLTHPLSLDF